MSDRPMFTASMTVLVLALAARSDAAKTGMAPLAGCTSTALANDASTSSSERAPNLKNRFGRTHYLILASEMAAAGITAGTSFSGIGWSFNAAPGLSGSTNLTVYMENTTDTTNAKSATWTTAISTMTVVHNAAVTVPNVTGTWDITFSGGVPFTYTGGGLYIAFDAQYPVGTLSTTTVVWCDSTGLANGLKGAQSQTSPPATLATSSFRPETRLTPSAGFANDAAVDVLMTLGDFPLGIGSPHVVRAVVTNKGTAGQTSLPVTLNVTGAETFTDSETVAALNACGGTAVVAFAPFTPSALGGDTIAVSVPPDDNPSGIGRNFLSEPFDVTPLSYSYKVPGSTPSGGVGFNGQVGQFVARFSTVGPTAVASVILEFFSVSATTYRIALYGDDGSGKPGAQLYVDAADRSVTAVGPTTITLPSPVPAGPGNFFVGIEQTSTVSAGFSYDAENPIRSGDFFFSTVLNAGPWTDFSPGNDIKIDIGLLIACTGGGQCNDQNPCTSDLCSGGLCSHAPLQQPGVITGDAFAADKATYSWDPDANATLYDVVRGRLDALPVGPGGGDETCLGPTATTSIVDDADPAEGEGVYYVVRGRNACTAPGTYGFASGGAERVTATCP